MAPVNLIANYYKRGPRAEIIYPFHFDRAGQYYVEKNYLEGIGWIDDPRRMRTQPPSWIRFNRQGKLLAKPAAAASVTTATAEDVYRQVLATAGAWPRDRTTLRTIYEVRQGTGRWGRNAPEHLSDAWILGDETWGGRNGYRR